MTGPKPVNRSPVLLPALTVLGHRPNAIETAFRQMGMAPQERQVSQADFAERMRQFTPAFLRAIPGGVAKSVGGVEEMARMLPNMLGRSGVTVNPGHDLTDKLVAYLHELMGADPQSEGGAIGQEMAQTAATVLPMIPGVPEAVGGALGKVGRSTGAMVARDMGAAREALLGPKNPFAGAQPLHEYQMRQQLGWPIPPELEARIAAQEAMLDKLGIR